MRRDQRKGHADNEGEAARREHDEAGDPETVRCLDILREPSCRSKDKEPGCDGDQRGAHPPAHSAALTESVLQRPSPDTESPTHEEQEDTERNTEKKRHDQPAAPSVHADQQLVQDHPSDHGERGPDPFENAANCRQRLSYRSHDTLSTRFRSLPIVPGDSYPLRATSAIFLKLTHYPELGQLWVVGPQPSQLRGYSGCQAALPKYTSLQQIGMFCRSDRRSSR
jgi:hypothetical protein